MERTFIITIQQNGDYAVWGDDGSTFITTDELFDGNLRSGELPKQFARQSSLRIN